MAASSFLTQLQRRTVIRMAGLCLVGAWLPVQVASMLFPAFGVPDRALPGMVILLTPGSPVALVFAWVFKLTPWGLKRDAAVPPVQSIAPRTARRMDRIGVPAWWHAHGYPPQCHAVGAKDFNCD